MFEQNEKKSTRKKIMTKEIKREPIMCNELKLYLN